jgi:hypothetical protein
MVNQLNKLFVSLYTLLYLSEYPNFINSLNRTEKTVLLSATIEIANTNNTVAQSLLTKIRSDNCKIFILQK